ncbi:MAG: crotonase/enoyl-CoA hydratase family protein [Gammaproteobacteria bacterium]|jgi:enoyl-CoA hydratase/carnithine racemase
MTFNTIKYEISDRILTLSLNRPEQMNAFTVEMAAELRAAFNRASDDDEVRVIVVTGAGKAFCAGMDLSAEGNVFGLDESLEPDLGTLQDRLNDPEIESGVRDTGGQLTLAIFECKKPVIAAINGAAVGIGATMTCAMDIRIASETARIGFVFNKIGITPEACSTWFLPRIVGMATALEWNLTGAILSADEVCRKGFVTAVYPKEQLLDQAYQMARQIARHSQVALALTRQMMYRNSSAAHPLEAHRVDSLAMFYCSQVSGKEGVAAFLEKRAPVFSDRATKDMPAFYPWW